MTIDTARCETCKGKRRVQDDELGAYWPCPDCTEPAPSAGVSDSPQAMRNTWDFVDETKLSPLLHKLNDKVSIVYPGYTEVLYEIDRELLSARSRIAELERQNERLIKEYCGRHSVDCACSWDKDHDDVTGLCLAHETFVKANIRALLPKGST